jgi:hypothetical protein
MVSFDRGLFAKAARCKGKATGGNTTMNAIDNLKNDKGRVNADGPPNPNGAKGKPDHQKKVGELSEKARAENPGMQIINERKIRTEGSNRRPDVQVVDPKTNKTTRIYEAERKPNSQRNLKREEEYKRLGIPNETHKVGN